MVVKVNLELTASHAVKAVNRGDVIIVIDVLRCSSSILNALANGAEKIVPVMTLKEAYRLHVEHPDFLLAGERKGMKPERFDLGNSPLEFTQCKVAGKTLILTTTSGTVALSRSSSAEWVLIGAFLNAHAVASKAIEVAERNKTGISLVLSGKKGRFSLEDFLCGGAIAARLPREKIELSDAASAALLAFKQAEDNLCETVMTGEHAQHLVRLGFKDDVKFSSQLDVFKIVPVYADGVITLTR